MMTPMSNRLIVKLLEVEATTPGGIIIPEAAKEKPTVGIVLAVGNYVEEVKVGYKVYFSKYAGNEVELDSENVLVISENDVIVYEVK